MASKQLRKISVSNINTFRHQFKTCIYSDHNTNAHETSTIKNLSKNRLENYKSRLMQAMEAMPTAIYRRYIPGVDMSIKWQQSITNFTNSHQNYNEIAIEQYNNFTCLERSFRSTEGQAYFGASYRSIHKSRKLDQRRYYSSFLVKLKNFFKTVFDTKSIPLLKAGQTVDATKPKEQRGDKSNVATSNEQKAQPLKPPAGQISQIRPDIGKTKLGITERTPQVQHEKEDTVAEALMRDTAQKLEVENKGKMPLPPEGGTFAEDRLSLEMPLKRKEKLKREEEKRDEDIGIAMESKIIDEPDDVNAKKMAKNIVKNKTLPRANTLTEKKESLAKGDAYFGCDFDDTFCGVEQHDDLKQVPTVQSTTTETLKAKVCGDSKRSGGKCDALLNKSENKSVDGNLHKKYSTFIEVSSGIASLGNVPSSFVLIPQTFKSCTAIVANNAVRLSEVEVQRESLDCEKHPKFLWDIVKEGHVNKARESMKITCSISSATLNTAEVEATDSSILLVTQKRPKQFLGPSNRRYTGIQQRKISMSDWKNTETNKSLLSPQELSSVMNTIPTLIRKDPRKVVEQKEPNLVFEMKEPEKCDSMKDPSSNKTIKDPGKTVAVTAKDNEQCTRDEFPSCDVDRCGKKKGEKTKKDCERPEAKDEMEEVCPPEPVKCTKTEPCEEKETGDMVIEEPCRSEEKKPLCCYNKPKSLQVPVDDCDKTCDVPSSESPVSDCAFCKKYEVLNEEPPKAKPTVCKVEKCGTRMKKCPDPLPPQNVCKPIQKRPDFCAACAKPRFEENPRHKPICEKKRPEMLRLSDCGKDSCTQKKCTKKKTKVVKAESKKKVQTKPVAPSKAKQAWKTRTCPKRDPAQKALEEAKRKEKEKLCTRTKKKSARCAEDSCKILDECQKKKLKVAEEKRKAEQEANRNKVLDTTLHTQWKSVPIKGKERWCDQTEAERKTPQTKTLKPDPAQKYQSPRFEKKKKEKPEESECKSKPCPTKGTPKGAKVCTGFGVLNRSQSLSAIENSLYLSNDSGDDDGGGKNGNRRLKFPFPAVVKSKSDSKIY